ncbi:BQ5605_C013g07407 [Microbotryum silenes-dioicae]|uniref:BQ5605_C013g07407 protein n=1 Tax=Microbotryum silenes-dioicae TaxID=796604 RepID=A0A2X0NUP4_9BASI|nr:BQ5605_C013g07407 [Microbotryum silenes-dioicae]
MDGPPAEDVAGDENGGSDGDDERLVSVELSKDPPVYPGATSTALMVESSIEDETSMCADLTSGVLVLTAGAGVLVGTHVSAGMVNSRSVAGNVLFRRR